MQPTQEQLLAAFNKAERQFWITPATVSTAPDPSTTGDPAFNSPWSYTGLPTVSFPDRPGARRLAGRDPARRLALDRRPGTLASGRVVRTSDPNLRGNERLIPWPTTS